MNKKLRKALTVVLAMVLVVSVVLSIRQLVDYRAGEADYSDAEALAGLSLQDVEPGVPTPGETESMIQEEKPETSEPEAEETEAPEAYYDPYVEALKIINLETLRETNSDVVGWIIIPGTEISYPLLQAEDNEYYLNHTWKNERNSVGAIFLECQVSADLSDFNTIVYGHRMRDESMFGGLKHYADISYWQEHPSVYVVDDNGVYRYDIFSAYEGATDIITFGLGISSQKRKQEFIDLSLEQSMIDTGVQPDTQEKILTLTTCTGRGYSTRWVVQAVLREGEPVWLET